VKGTARTRLKRQRARLPFALNHYTRTFAFANASKLVNVSIESHCLLAESELKTRVSSAGSAASTGDNCRAQGDRRMTLRCAGGYFVTAVAGFIAMAACGTATRSRPAATASVAVQEPTSTTTPENETCGAIDRMVSAENKCIAVAGRLVVHALLPVHYTKTASGRTFSRQLYQLDCDSSGECTGIYLNLDRTDDGGGITMFDLGRVVGAQIVSRTGAMTVIRWGDYRTFIVDMSRGAVTYSESGEGLFGPVDGRGEVPCKAETSD